MNKKLLEGLIAELRSDDDFAKLVFYFLGNGLRTMHQEIESGRDDDIAKSFISWVKRSGIYPKIH